jgi:hypothetical protein
LALLTLLALPSPLTLVLLSEKSLPPELLELLLELLEL